MQLAQPYRAGWGILLFLQIFLNRLQFLQSLWMWFFLRVTQLLEIPSFFFENAFQSFTVKNHGFHCYVIFLQSAQLSFGTGATFQQQIHRLYNFLIILKADLILIFQIFQPEIILDVSFIQLWQFLFEEKAKRCLIPLFHLDLLFRAGELIYQFVFQFVQLLLSFYEACDVLEEVVLGWF